MRPRPPAWSRFLGLWTAGWLAVLLVLGMVRFGDPAVQWPVLLVPVLWALVAVRPRRRSRGAAERPRRRGDAERPRRRRLPEPDPGWDPETYDDVPPALPPGTRTDTVERPALRRPRDPREDDRW